MKKLSLLAMLGASLVLPSRASSAIRECSSIQDVIGEVRPGTLVVFDIDNTILRPAQVLGSDEWFHYYLMKMKLEMADQSQAFIQAVDLLHSIYFVTQVKAMEECTADVLHSLQNKGVTMMGLTSRSPPVANISIRHLKSLGIDMNLTAPTHACFSLIDIPETLFFQGVLFTNGKSKKNALSAFFKQISWKPKKIVFIDDRRKYLEEANAYEDEGLEFVGLRYNLADAYVNTLDPQICEIELQSFLSLMSDRAASQHLSLQTKAG